MSKNNSPVIVALDFSNQQAVMDFVERIPPGSCRLKIGKELFTHAGPSVVRAVVDKGFDVFLDLKYHDIPNTVAQACGVAADLGVWMVNVHASGGRKMMTAAAEALDKRQDAPLLIAVTVLTSMDAEDLQEVGVQSSPQEQVQRLALLAKESGIDGVVCSPLETTMLNQQMGDDFVLVTPGIRPGGSDVGDQKRIMTPVDAIKAGSHYLVIGRPITQADDPLSALGSINLELGV